MDPRAPPTPPVHSLGSPPDRAHPPPKEAPLRPVEKSPARAPQARRADRASTAPPQVRSSCAHHDRTHDKRPRSWSDTVPCQDLWCLGWATHRCRRDKSPVARLLSLGYPRSQRSRSRVDMQCQASVILLLFSLPYGILSSSILDEHADLFEIAQDP